MNKHLVVVKDTMDGKSVSIFFFRFCFFGRRGGGRKKIYIFLHKKKIVEKYKNWNKDRKTMDKVEDNNYIHFSAHTIFALSLLLQNISITIGFSIFYNALC